jgi:hypothetical protein
VSHRTGTVNRVTRETDTWCRTEPRAPHRACGTVFRRIVRSHFPASPHLLEVQDVSEARELFDDAVWLGRLERLEAHARSAEQRSPP